ncbi:MAG: sodium:solute symporter family protein [Bacteroidota bacterium]|nr:sodium:solute symporter family protein [Bacteroidota bacterium]
MSLHPIDLTIILVYLILTISLGFWISKRASKNLDSYFLGGKSIPWYMLGMSNASGMFDITGTMWMVAICFIYGVKSVWLPWLWPVWNQIVLMMFLAVWMRRSNVMTGAEWLKTRFGEGRGAKLSHISVVIFALFAVIGFIAYAFEGIGKFSVIFLPWDLSTRLGGLYISSERMYALIIMGVTTLYVIKGGMYSVVITEVLQFVIMTVACIIIGVIAINAVSHEQIMQVVPDGWSELLFRWRLDLHWSGFSESVNQALNQKILTDGYELFGIFIMMMVFRGILVSIAGPVPGYDMQRVLATRTPRESALMSGSVNIALFFPRYLMIAGLTVLAVVKLQPEMLMNEGVLDFEKILPFALNNFIPVGVLGIILAGLIAAFMSTFAANVNAGPAYIVNDIYKRFINPNASNKTLVRASYLASLGLVIVGISVGFFVQDINSILQWITAALFGGYAASNFLKWIWWRFNGYGYFWGMIGGLIASLAVPKLMPDLSVILAFPIILGVASLGSFLGTLLTPPDDEQVLKSFVKNVNPWGWWKPIRLKLQSEDPDFVPNKNFLSDMGNVAIGIVWQMSLILMPVYLVIREMRGFWISLVVFLFLSVVLKYSWYDKLKK